MKAPEGYVIAYIPEIHQEFFHNSEIRVDNTWEIHQYKNTKVKVVAIPDRLPSDPCFGDHDGTMILLSDFSVEVMVDDFIYTDWSVLDESYSIGDNLYKIPYSAIYAVERKANCFELAKRNSLGESQDWTQYFVPTGDINKQMIGEEDVALLIPLMSWVFLEPYYGEGIEEENGIKVRKKDGLVIETNPKELQYTARVKYIGTNVYGLKPNYKAGDLAFVNLEWASVVTIQGQELYAVRQNQLMGRLKIN